MRSSVSRGLMLSALVGTFVLAAGPAALAAPATQSPEGIALFASGAVSADVADSTTATSPQSVASGGVTGLLDLTLLASTATTTGTGNAATAEVGSVSTAVTGLLSPILSGLVGVTATTTGAEAVTSSCTWNSSATGSSAFTLTAAIANLKVLGITIPVGDLTGLTPTPGGTNVTTLAGVTLPSLPLGLSVLNVYLDDEEPGPVTGSETINAVEIQIGSTGIFGNSGLETIYLASSTCGGSSSVVATPVAGGKGLGIGLGLLGLLGAGVATVYARRRRMFA
jgi:hypothetical protein